MPNSGEARIPRHATGSDDHDLCCGSVIDQEAGQPGSLTKSPACTATMFR
jgi:hypothetical protein